MTSMITSSVILFLWYLMIAQCRAGGYTTKVQRFLSIYNGDFDNNLQHLMSAGVIGRAQIRIETVSVPVLNDPVVYLEIALDGDVVVLLVFEVTEGPGENQITLTPYKVNDTMPYKANQFNTSDLATLEREDYQRFQDCVCVFNLFPSGGYTSAWTDCTNNINGKYAEYAVTIDCDTLLFVRTFESLDTDVPISCRRLDKSRPQPSPCYDSQ